MTLHAGRLRTEPRSPEGHMWAIIEMGNGLDGGRARRDDVLRLNLDLNSKYQNEHQIHAFLL